MKIILHMEDNIKRRLRSQVSDEERQKMKEALLAPKKYAIDERPFIQYNGKIRYFTTQVDCAISCDALLNTANNATDLFVIGFDLEWPFSFQTGSGKTAVIQVSPSLDECFIFHVSTVKCLPKSLTELLAHDKVRLAGVNIKNDIRKLSRDFVGINTEKVIEKCVELSSLANTIYSIGGRWSMEKLVNHFFDMRINKDKKVRNSKWHVIPLSEEQQIYAATDAYVSLKLFHHLKQLEAEILAKENDHNHENI
ncbi:WRNexo [Trypoxylus dichotomus]